jgi:hypothetical protein
MSIEISFCRPMSASWLKFWGYEKGKWSNQLKCCLMKTCLDVTPRCQLGVAFDLASPLWNHNMYRLLFQSLAQNFEPQHWTTLE